jgi:hypothetical protein
MNDKEQQSLALRQATQRFLIAECESAQLSYFICLHFIPCDSRPADAEALEAAWQTLVLWVKRYLFGRNIAQTNRVAARAVIEKEVHSTKYHVHMIMSLPDSTRRPYDSIQRFIAEKWALLNGYPDPRVGAKRLQSDVQLLKYPDQAAAYMTKQHYWKKVTGDPLLLVA